MVCAGSARGCLRGCRGGLRRENMLSKIDVRKKYGASWPREMMPLGFGTIDVEPFADWWRRHKAELSNLHPEICEQWIYRHWEHSTLRVLPLDRLEWSEERWTPQEFLSTVGLSYGQEPIDPTWDYDCFHQHPNNPTARALDQGAWDFAPVVLRTSDGFYDTHGRFCKSRYLLVEGHQRRRYLGALVARGVELENQRVFVLTLTAGDNR